MPDEFGRNGLESRLYDDFDDDFDPLAVDDEIIDQEDMDDDNPLDTIDFPTLRNMPEQMSHTVYTPERQGGVEGAVKALVERNPARREVLLSIIDICRDGCASSEVARRVNDIQKDNRSVYAPMTLCRMLERAGALLLEVPESAEEVEDIQKNVAYLEIKDTVDPVWYASEEGLRALESLSADDEFRDIVLNRDSRYLDVYRAVMEFVAQQGRSKKEIDELVDTFEIVMHPRRFGGHFIDMLERTGAMAWKDRSWHLTDFGRTMLDQMNGAA